MQSSVTRKFPLVKLVNILAVPSALLVRTILAVQTERRWLAY